MRKYIIYLLYVLAVAFSASAQQFTENGYYRIQNNYTERYCYLVDNWVYVDMTASKVTLSSIELWKGIEKAQSDPSTVLYISQENSKYNIKAQGTTLYDIADAYLNLRFDTSRNAYLAYGTYSGLTKYLTDNTPAVYAEQAWMCDTRYGEYSYWRLLPISNSTDNYFGIKPTVTAGGKYYAPMYCDFPFEAASGMTIYYVSSVDAKRGLAIYKPVESGKVAAKTPMFIQCGSSIVAGNKVNIGVTGATTPTDNKLTGVYFNVNNYYHPHVNQTKYNADTMRLLGVTAAGELGFVTSTEDYVPHNSVYLSVPKNSPADFKLVTPAEYQYILDNEVIEAASVTLSQSSLTLQLGQSAQLTATVAPANTTDKTVVWTSSDQNVATVDANGKVTANGIGQASITAKCGDVSATCSVTVNPIPAQSVTISQTALSLTPGQTVTLTATVAPANATDKTVVWTSSDQNVATVDANGKVTAVSVGQASITAKCGNVSATCSVTVNPIPAQSVTLSQTALSLTPGQTATLTATVAPANTTDKTVVWTSSDQNVATVDANGKVTAKSVGHASITAKCGNVSATCSVTVNPIPAQSVTLSQTALSLTPGQTATLTVTVAPANATDKTVAWTSSDENVATVDANGKVTAVSVGQASITAKCGNVSATCSVTVNPIPAQSVTLSQTTLSLNLGQTATLTATVLPEDATDKTVVWTSSDENVATIDANGTVTAKAIGTATVTATCGSIAATCAVTVNPIEAERIDLDKTSLTLYIGDESTLTAVVLPENTTFKTLTWSSTDTSVVTVDDNGHVKAIAPGTANIIVTCGAASAVCEVAVYPIGSEAIGLNKISLNLYIGEEETLIATVLPEDTTDKTVVWTSSDENVATVDDNGKVIAVSIGQALITATCGNVSATCSVTVNPIPAQSVTLNQTELSLTPGQIATLTATVAPEDTTDKTVVWTSSDENVATVDDNGKVVALAVGTTTITATCGSVSAICQVSVSKYTQEIVWLQTFDEILIGSEIELTAEATSGLDVTYSITSGSELASIQGNTLHLDAEGVIEITASQEGNELYFAADPVVKSITIITSSVDSVNIDDDAIVEVYSITGVRVYRGSKAEIPSTLKGLYIVSTAGKAYKTVL